MKQVNLVPITPLGPVLNTWEVVCATCGQLKWPTLSERPTSYVCSLCRMADPAKRATRREAGRKGAAAKQRPQIEPG
jgi:hypothetical protein